MPMARVGQAGMDDVGGIQDWYDSIPIITRFWFTGALAATALGNFGVVSVTRLVWDFNAVKNQFEIWRIVVRRHQRRYYLILTKLDMVFILIIVFSNQSSPSNYKWNDFLISPLAFILDLLHFSQQCACIC